MPQETNLNISPYFDDFDKNNQYYRVLFKPGLPVQARELTTLQSILQNQVEQLGNHLFKEGSVVIPGQINYNNTLYAIEIENEYLGKSFETYNYDVDRVVIRGENSNVKAKILFSAGPKYSERGYWTLFVNYLGSGIDGKSVFDDREVLIVDEVVKSSVLNLQIGQGFAITAPSNATSIGSAVILSEGIYFLRGNFVKVNDQILILDAHSTNPTYRVGFEIIEELITASQDSSLSDNAKGFNNYASPGADRLKITANLVKKPLDSEKTENFVELMVVRSGAVSHIQDKAEYNVLAEELARRTYDQSGDFYVKAFSAIAKESLDNKKGNDGVFSKDQLTYTGQVPSDALGVYKISPGKAYVKGYEVAVPNITYLDFKKTRDSKTLLDQEVNYITGPTLTLNRVSGAPRIGFSTSSIVSLRDTRIGSSTSISYGKEIGIARVYDYALESGSYSDFDQNLNQWNLSLFDIQTYTELTLNEPSTLTLPTHIEGKSSGATAYLKYNTVGVITAYNSKGTFLKGERLIFNGIENSRILTNIDDYNINDVKSIYSLVGSGITFNADTLLNQKYAVGQVYITPKSGTAPGICTVTSNSVDFTNIAKVGSIVAFTNTLLGATQVKTYAKISEIIDRYNFKIVGITTVSSVCDGGLPTTGISPTNFEILQSKFQSSTDNTLYTPLPKKWISDVDLTDSSLRIRKEFNVTITANSTGSIQSDSDEAFLPYDEERYVLVNSSGYIETLSADKFTFSSGNNEITISGLSNNTGSARLIATLNKIKISNKIKNKIRINSIIVNKSKYESSGIGSTTLNDGLSYGNYGYGLRVQDPELCLLVPDVTKVYGVFESSDTTDPKLPKLSLFNLTGSTGRVDDLLIGEEFFGKESGAVGLYVNKIDSLNLEFVYLNDLRFTINETIEFAETNITGIIQRFNNGDLNILNKYSLDSGQRETICDYSRLIRKDETKEPKKKIKIIYESAQYSPSDTGDITTISSYNQLDFCTLPEVKNNLRLTDIIDIRPRVLPFDATSTGSSPFEFNSRSFSDAYNSSKYVLASGESLLLNYSYYLSRIDKISLNRNRTFQLTTGVPSDIPTAPDTNDDCLEVATIYLPPYICNPKNISISLSEHKRYRMRDIAVLEQRIKNLEYYTALSLLESKTENLHIPDNNGLNRYKSGIFVDNFTSTGSQLKVGGVTNSIDTVNSELRPSPFTTQIDLLLGTKNVLGIGTQSPAEYDTKFSNDIIGTNIRRTGQLITLDYTDFLEVKQPFATRVENVVPFLVTNYMGRIELFPSSDIWIDQVRLEPQRINVDNYTETRKQLEVSGYDPQTGLSPVNWGAWNITWTGSTTTVANTSVQTGSNSSSNGWATVITNSFRNTETTTVVRTGTQTRGGTQLRLGEQTTTINEGDRVISNDIIPFMRSRNIEFTGRKFKPLTRVYAFFDAIDVNKFVVPKLIEIAMISGKFNVGEIITGSMSTGTITENNNTTASITFRVAQSNHKYGPITSPTDVFERSPYDETYTIPSEYSTSSILLNVDTTSLSNITEGLYSGFIQNGMRLRGEEGEAEIVSVRLFTDNIGVVIGSFFVPNPNILTNPSFETGIKIFKLTSSLTNSLLDDPSGTQGDEQYFAQGTINNVQETIRSTRSPRFDTISVSETTAATPDVQISDVVTNSTSTQVIPFPPPPPPPPPNPPTPPNPPPTPTPRPVAPPVSPPVPPQPPPRPPTPPPVTPPRRGKDPLAQSFTVNNDVGAFATKIDLYFRTKDDSLPLMVQLRPMVNGVPSEEIYPFSEVFVDPSQINVSGDATLPTRVNFQSPVYLKPGVDHAVVLISQSNEYTAWISRMGEIDVSTLNQPESRQITVSAQPLLGSLFKSQNGSTWNPSQYEDLKFDLYTARFTGNTGSVSFYNPELSKGNAQIATLIKDPLEFNSKKLIVTLDNTSDVSGLNLGNTIIQTDTNASANYVGAGGSATGTLNIVNSGIGYTPSNGSNYTFNDVQLTSLTGSGKNATANITINSGVAIGATISNGGSGYQIGDVLTAIQVGSQTLGRNLQLSLSSISGINELILDQVQGDFEISLTKNIQYVNNTGITTLVTTSGSNALAVGIELYSQESDGLHIKVYHKNHGMHSNVNQVIIQDVDSDILPSTITVNYSNSDSGSISIADTSNFAQFESVSVGATNPGYVLIENEIISYGGVSNGELIDITRGIDQTRSYSYPSGTIIKKYENNNISLRRINKTHNLQDSTVTNSIGLDYYYLKLDMSSNGVDRSVGTSFPKLFIDQSKSTGGSNVHATQNIQFELVKPILQTLVLPKTNIKGEIRTISGTSISGNEQSFVEKEYVPLNLNEETYFESPRIIASKVNETEQLDRLIGNKSMTINLNLSTVEPSLSPVIDLDRTGLVLVSNRVNKIITDYASDGRVATIVKDPTAFIYANNPIGLENSATSIKVLLAAYVNTYSDIRAFYAVSNNLDNDLVYYPFPGYLNIDINGNIIDIANNDGSSNKLIQPTDTLSYKSDDLIFRDYEFSIDNLPQFRYFSVKLLGTSTNQAFPPRIKDLRIIALA
jgi:hypothetical protein